MKIVQPEPVGDDPLGITDQDVEDIVAEMKRRQQLEDEDALVASLKPEGE